MFEHALLQSGPAPERRRAIALAFLGQAGTVAGLIILSVFYADRIVPVHLVQLVAPPLIAMRPLPEVKPQTIPSHSSVTLTSARPSFAITPSVGHRFVADTGAPDLTPPTDIVIGNGTSRNAVPGVDFGGTGIIAAAPPAEPEPVKQPAAKVLSGPLRVSEGVATAMLIKKVLPVYPALAKTARISGTVQLNGIIGRDGHIRELQVVSGHPMLVQAALEAVRQWVYRPTLLNNQPVEVQAPIQVNFVLN